MPTIDRRGFLGAALGGLSAWAAGSMVPAARAGWKPETLFLTWRRDPTTTMSVQWIAPAAPAGIPIGYAEVGETTFWRAVATTQRPYPMTDLHLFRAELTGLRPGTEYLFTIGGNPTTHRFRLLSGLLSTIATRSPTFAVLFSSCATNFDVRRSVLP